MEGYCQTEGINTYFVTPLCEEKSWGYELEMLYNNFIPGLIQPEFRYIDGHLLSYNKINGMKACDTILKSGGMNVEKALNLFRTILSTVKELGEYMLYQNGLVLDTKTIFMSVKSGDFYLIYAPGQNEDIRKGIKRLAEEVIKYINHRNHELVDLVYGVYDLTTIDNYDLKLLEEHLMKMPEQIPQSGCADSQEDRLQRARLLDEIFSDEIFSGDDADSMRTFGKNGNGRASVSKTGVRENNAADCLTTGRTQVGHTQAGHMQAKNMQTGHSQAGRTQGENTKTGHSQAGRAQGENTKTGNLQTTHTQAKNVQTGRAKTGDSQTTHTQVGSMKNDIFSQNHTLIMGMVIGVTAVFGVALFLWGILNKKLVNYEKPLMAVLVLLAAEIFILLELKKKYEAVENSEEYSDAAEKKNNHSMESENLNYGHSGGDEGTNVIPMRHRINPERKEATQVRRMTGCKIALLGNRGNIYLDVGNTGIVIGRDEKKAQLVIEDKSVSRRQAILKLSSDGLVVYDAGSTNGTYLNGRYVSREEGRHVKDGDRLMFGEVEYTVQMVEPASYCL